MDPVIQALDIISTVLAETDEYYMYSLRDITVADYSQEVQRRLVDRIKVLKENRLTQAHRDFHNSL